MQAYLPGATECTNNSTKKCSCCTAHIRASIVRNPSIRMQHSINDWAANITQGSKDGILSFLVKHLLHLIKIRCLLLVCNIRFDQRNLLHPEDDAFTFTMKAVLRNLCKRGKFERKRCRAFSRIHGTIRLVGGLVPLGTEGKETVSLVTLSTASN